MQSEYEEVCVILCKNFHLLGSNELLVNEQEGITWDHINFTDNEQAAAHRCTDGLISVLNEECMRPMGTMKLSSKLTTLHKTPRLFKGKLYH